jgi:hypothetical protein
MPFTDLLRLTVFLAAGEATALGAVTIFSAGANDDTPTLLVSAGWWTVAVAIGLYLGRRSRAAEGVRDVLAAARTAFTAAVGTVAGTGAVVFLGLAVVAALAFRHQPGTGTEAAPAPEPERVAQLTG